MRTKHILTALALPALFAACTADEFVNEDFGKTAERAKVSKNFSLITSEDATTRYAVDGETSLKFLFEKGDRIGAAIIDEMDPSKEDPKDWTIIPSLAGNYPFEYDGSQWNSATTLGIGHYLFVYPYDKSDNNRAAVSYSLPTVQKLYKGENGALDLNAAIEAGDKAVFSSVLYEGDTQLAAKLQGLYTYPKFVINFDNGLPITSISQVVLEYSDTPNNNIEGFEVKGGFNHEKVAKAFADAETADDEKAYWDGVQTADFLIQQGENINGKTATDYTTKAYSKYLIAKLPDNTPVKVNSITNNKYIEVRFMMPGVGQRSSAGQTEYGTNLKMHIYTNNGIYTINNVWESIDWKSTTSAEAKSKALLRGKSNTMTLKKDAPKAGTALTIVTNIADWNTLVDAYGATADQTISIVGDEFFFDSTVKMPSKAIFTVNTPVSVKGDVTLKNIKAEDVITVEKGAKLTTSANFTATKVLNKGAMVIAQALDADGDVVEYSKVSEIENQGTLAVAKDAVATFELTNAKGATVENDGTMTVSGTNGGVINNNAVMNTNGFTNGTREYNNNKVVNEPTINNNKDAKLLSKSGVLKNEALIVNNGTLTCKSQNGTIANGKDGEDKPAVLDSKAGAITYITNNQDGKVIVYAADTEGLTISDAKGIVEYTTGKDKENFEGSLVNTVIASKSLTIEAIKTNAKSLKSLTFTNSATLKVEGAAGKTVGIDELIVNAGKTTLGTNISLNTITVAKGASVVVPEGKALTISGPAMDNKGTILVGGTFKAENIYVANGGNVEDNGGDAQITWKATPADKAKSDYKAAVIELVNTWIENSANVKSSWENVTVAKIASSSWTSSVLWVTTAANKFVTTYNAYKEGTIATAEVGDIIKNDEDGFVAEAITDAKTAADSKVTATIKKYINSNEWLLDESQDVAVYMKKAADAELDEIVDESNKTMVEAFAEKVKAITKDEAGSNAVYLSLQGFAAKDVTDELIPDNSYINVYETSDEYKAAKLWKEAATDFADEDWYKNISDEYGFPTDTAATMKMMKKFFNEVNKVDTTGDILLEKQLASYKEMAETVIDWNYADAQIAALAGIVAGN